MATTKKTKAKPKKASTKKTASKNSSKKKLFAPLAPVGRGIKTVGHYAIPPYFRNSWRELKMVTWPGWKLSRQLTVAVILFAVVFAVFIGLLDWGLDAAFKQLFLKK